MASPNNPYANILKYVLLYAVFAGLWIWLTDMAVSAAFNDPDQLFLANTIKGWFFVAVTAALFYGLMRDIVRKLQQDAVRANRLQVEKLQALQLLDAIVQGSTDSIFSKDAQGRYLLFNKAAERVTGKPAQEVLGRDDTSIFNSEDAVVVMADDRQVMAQNRVITWEHKLTTSRGVRVFSTTQGPMHDTQGRVTGVFGIARDITDIKAAENALRESEHRLLLAQEGAHIGIWEWDVLSGQSYWSPEAERLYGFAPGALRSNEDWRSHVHPDDLPLIDAEWERHIAQGLDFEVEFRFLRESGEMRWLVSRGRAQYDESGKPIRLSGVNLDITERKAAEEQLRKLSLAVEQSPESIVITDLDARVEYANESFVRNSGYSREEIVGQNPRILHSGKTPRATFDDLWKTLAEGRTWQGEFRNRRKDGSEYIEHAIVSPLRQRDGRITHYVAVKEDITSKKSSEAEIHRLAYYDSLTGLPNRALLLDRMGMMLPIAQRQRRVDALMIFNLDRFKNINDTGGQAIGDKLLNAVAERLGGLLREGDMLARLSGDEFAILLPDLARQRPLAAHHAAHVAEKLQAGLRESFQIGDEQFVLTASIGVALFPVPESDTPIDILRRAVTALHQSKAGGGAQTTLFELSMDESAKQRFRIERELRLAIPAGQLRLYLQPQVDAFGRIVGAEALVRWQHPEQGLIPPGVFIPVAEESDLIIEIGNWVFGRVCHLLAQEWMIGQPYRISVNISPRQFRQPDFVSWAKKEIAASGAEPTHLTFEVTEGVVIDNINNVIAKMNELAAMGIHFSLDDFGTGYSSLAYLKRLPIHEIKIDKTFVQDAPSDPDDAALVETILSVAKHMHLKVVAEGVETQEQADFLNQRGQVIHQGYLFSRPQPVEDWESLVRAEVDSRQ